MKVYDYYKTAEDRESGRVYATFTEAHEAERLHFEGLAICPICVVSHFNSTVVEAKE